MTLRQLKDAGNFFHDGSLTKIRDVVEYFNAGVPADPTAGKAGTLGNRQLDVFKITNNGTTAVDTHQLAVARGLPRGARLTNASGVTKAGEPYLRLFLDEGALAPGQSTYAAHCFARPANLPRLSDRLELLSGQGTP